MAQLKLRILLLFFFVKTLFIQTNEQEYTVKTSHDTIKAERGSDVILPCHLKPPSHVSRLVVKWTRGSETVHLSVRGQEKTADQDPLFKNRTQLFHQEIEHGNISLKLFKVTKKDEGNYTCSVSKLDGQVRNDNVTLITVELGIKEEHKEEPKNNNDSKGLVAGGISVIVIIIIIISAIVAFLIWRKYRRGKQQNANQPSSSEPLRQNQTNPVNEEVPLNNLPADQPTNQQQPPVHEEVQPVNEEVPLNNINDVMSEE